MNDVVLFHLDESTKKLPHQFLLLMDEQFPGYPLFESKVKVLHLKVESFFSFKDVLKGDDKGTFEHLQNIDFVVKRGFVFALRKSFLIETFYCKLLTIFSLDFKYLGEGTFSDFLQRGRHFLEPNDVGVVANQSEKIF